MPDRAVETKEDQGVLELDLQPNNRVIHVYTSCIAYTACELMEQAEAARVMLFIDFSCYASSYNLKLGY